MANSGPPNNLFDNLLPAAMATGVNSTLPTTSPRENIFGLLVTWYSSATICCLSFIFTPTLSNQYQSMIFYQPSKSIHLLLRRYHLSNEQLFAIFATFNFSNGRLFMNIDSQIVNIVVSNSVLDHFIKTS